MTEAPLGGSTAAAAADASPSVSEAPPVRRWWQPGIYAIFPLAILAVSAWRAPYLFDLQLAGADADLEHAERPVLLYERTGTSIYFTTDDLLYPDRWGPAAPRYQAVLFDVYPGAEPWFREPHRLTWIVVCSRALLSGADAMPDGNQSAASSTNDLPERFMKAMADELPRLERGSYTLFNIPETAEYRRQTGIRWFGALAVTLPRVPVEERLLANAPQQLERAVGDAVAALAADSVRGVGLPLIDAAERLADEFSDATSWTRMLTLADRLAAERRLDTIVLGAFGLTERTRESKRTGFMTAWSRERERHAAVSGVATHHFVRLAAFAMLGVVARLAWLHRTVSARRLLAFGVGSFAGASLVATVSSGASAFVGGAGTPALLAAEVLLALAVGVWLETILTYDVRKELADGAGPTAKV